MLGSSKLKDSGDNREKILYLMIGTWNTLLGIIIFGIFLEALSQRLHYLIILFLAQIIAVTNSYVMQGKFVFNREQHRPLSLIGFYKFTLSSTIGLAGSALIVFSLVQYAHFSPLIAGIFSTGTSVVIGYSLHKHYSFKKKSEERDTKT